MKRGMTKMVDRQTKLVATVLIVIAAVFVLWVFGMWMMPWMMGNMMSGMMGSMRGYMGLYMFGPLLLAAVLIVLAVVLLRRSGGRNGEK
jgi:glucan phosphoethanolaminetransferase (alkaline phosphatase superfamily)